MDKGEIEQKTKGILESTFGGVESLELPIKIGEIAERNGITIKQGDFKHPDISGSYDRSTKTIIVDTDDEPTRQAFTIAHELGHHFLHEGEKETEVYLRYYSEKLSFEKQLAEQQANLFAASILMPEEILRREWENSQDERFLATKFGVSQSAMHYRLMNLELPVEVEDGVPY